MDFRKLSKISLPQNSSGGTAALNLTDIPNNILDALVPGYSLVSKYILTAYGFDISLLVSVAVIGLALFKGGQYAYGKATRGFRYLFVSSVYIDDNDDLFDMMMDWLATKYAKSSRRSAWAKTQRGNRGLDDYDDIDDALDDDGMFDYNRWSARTPPRYEPYYGMHILWIDGRPFLFHRSQKKTVGQNLSVRWGGASEDDLIQIDCLGRSVEPIREMLRTVKLWSLQKQRNNTTIRHPTPKDRARFSGSWSKTFSRPSRPMDTVILDAEQKRAIIKDMNEYLHPASPKWYATRGIPYRRGYLFHGPPGTGKTSLSFALAGIFGLEIYVIALQDPTLTEGDLMQLFNTLPKRCIVLLEDVDAAGLVRDGKGGLDNSSARSKGRKGPTSEKEKTTNSESVKEQVNGVHATPKKDEEFTLKDLAKELKAVSTPTRGNRDRSDGNPDRKPGTGISLSGLLNAIDGVASHEGRVLIMTTNHSENLDAALVRPGRVDRKVEFTMAAREQIKELFYRMYVSSGDTETLDVLLEEDISGSLNGSANGSAEKKMANGHAEHNDHQHPQSPMSKVTLDELSVEFAVRIPEHTYTPAEIQNHLLRYKKEPRMALEKAREWIKEIEDEKEKDRKAKEEKDNADDAYEE